MGLACSNKLDIFIFTALAAKHFTTSCCYQARSNGEHSSYDTKKMTVSSPLQALIAAFRAIPYVIFHSGAVICEPSEQWEEQNAG